MVCVRNNAPRTRDGAGARAAADRRPQQQEAAPDHGQARRGEGDGVFRAKASE